MFNFKFNPSAFFSIKDYFGNFHRSGACLLFFVVLFLQTANCFGENIFFINIKKKPLAVQIDILEKRIAYDSQNLQDITTAENIKYYLEIKTSQSDALNFLMPKIKNAKDVKFQKIALQNLLDSLPLRIYFLNLKHFSDFFQKDLKKIVVEYVYKNMTDENIDLILLNRSYFSNFFSENHSDPQILNLALKVATDYGFLSEASEMIKAHAKILASDEWLKFRNCNLLGYLKKYDQAINCFLPMSLGWSYLGVARFRFAQGKSKSEYQAEFQKAKNKLKSELNADLYAVVLMYQVLLFNDLEKEDKSFLSQNNFSKNLFVLFLMATLCKEKKILEDQYINKARSDLGTFHKTSYLAKIGLGEEKPTLIGQYLPQDSLLYQAVKGSLGK